MILLKRGQGTGKDEKISVKVDTPRPFVLPLTIARIQIHCPALYYVLKLSVRGAIVRVRLSLETLLVSTGKAHAPD